MAHFSDAIRRSGSPFEYLTNMYEHMHINLMKVAYWSNNWGDYTGQILRYNSQLQAYHWKLEEVEAIETTSERTTLDQVCNTLNM